MPLPPHPRRALRAARLPRLRPLLAALALLGATSLAHAQIRAFPGAEGYGAFATGGRGGDVYYVTNTNASGAGSLAEGISTAPVTGRTIVFGVSGYIPINGLRVTNPKLTIAGQTAPGDGIGLRNGTFRISSGDVVVRHLRFRHGKSGSGGDCINLDSGSTSAILDHITMQFSTDENMSSFGNPPENLTLQYSLNSWGLESHSCGGLWDQGHATAHHTLWSHNHTRNPKARPGLLEWVNNVTFDWDIGFIMGDSETPAGWRSNLINNYFICPPGNLQSKALVKGTLSRDNVPNFTVHLGGNLIDNDGDGLLNGTDKGYSIVEGSVYNPAESPAPAVGSYRYYQSVSPIPGSTAGVVTDSPRLAYKKIVSNAGPLRLDATYPGTLRDEVDTILINKLVSQTPFHVSRETDTGASGEGFGILASAPAPLDGDRDGMPDYWETALGWNAAVQDHNTTLPGSGGLITGTTFFPASTPLGYTRLEEYLHFLAIPHASIAKNTAAGPTSLAVDLRKFTSGFTPSPVFTLAGVIGGSAVQSGPGGAIVTFTPTPDTFGRARFQFTVTDASGDTWTQTFALLVSANAFPRDLLWQGDSATNAWNESAPNWLRNGAATAYAVGDRVTFDDTGSRSPAVATAGALTPGSVDVDTALGYTFGGSGTLTSTGPLAKRGPGALTLSVPASFAGGVSLDAGSLVINPGGGLAGGAVTLQDGTSITSNYAAGTQLTLSGGLVVPTGASATVNLSPRMAIVGASGAGTLRLNAPGTTFIYNALNGSFSNFTGTLNIVGTVPNALVTAQFNGGGFNGALGGATVNLDNVQIVGRHNSGGNTLAIGALTGTSTARIIGSGYAGAMTLTVGALNQSTTFAGAITDGSAPAATIFNKVGTGTLTLTGASTHTGATTVSAGTLVVDGSLGATPLTVSSGATLAGDGSIAGTVTIPSGATISPGNTPGATATLTAGALTLNAAKLRFDLSANPAGTNDKIQLTGGALSLTGTQTFQFNLTDGTLGAGTYSLVETTGALVASGAVLASNLPTGARQTFALQRNSAGTSPSYIRLAVTGTPASLVWKGAPGGASWDLSTPGLWQNGPATDTFFNFDAITFDDTALTGTVNLTAPVAPRTLTVTNSALAYTFSGEALTGSTQLVKNGSGTLTLSPVSPAQNTYTGGTLLNEGTILLATDHANSHGLGTGPLTFGPGTTLTMYDNVAGDNLAAWGLVVPGGVTASFNADSRVTLTGPLTGSGTLNFRIPYIRTNLTGDWSAFAGVLNITTDADGGEFRFGTNYAYPAFPAAAIVLADRVTALYLGTVAEGVGTTLSIGQLSGAPLSTLKGGATGGRSLTYRIGGRGGSTTFAGAITEQAAGASTSIVKTGAGVWTLAGPASHVGGTTVEQGTLILSGSITNASALTVAPGATLALNGGTIEVDTVQIQAGAALTGAGTINNELVNDGTLTVANGGTLTITGDVTNTGTIRLTGGSTLVATGAFVNSGILDLITAGGALPPNLENNGVVLDSSAAKLNSYEAVGTAFTLRLTGYSGHEYTLQTTTDLTTPWTDLETRPGITGQELVFTHDAGPAPRCFYRIVVGP